MPRDAPAILPFGGCERSHPDHRQPFEVGRQFGLSVLAQSDVGAAKPAGDQAQHQHYVRPRHLDGTPVYSSLTVGVATKTAPQPVDGRSVFAFQETANFVSLLVSLG